MPVFTHHEAVYGALCYIYGDDDYMISSHEKYGIKHNFRQHYHLPDEVMETISKRWAIDSAKFYAEIIEGLNACSFAERLEAYRIICLTINNFSHERDDRWIPAHQIKADIGISDVEYDRYAKSVEQASL